jgi:hypothetical protein
MKWNEMYVMKLEMYLPALKAQDEQDELGQKELPPPPPMLYSLMIL